MTNEDAAAAGFDKARQIYTGKDASGNKLNSVGVRYKSSNKLHLASGSSQLNAAVLDIATGLKEEDPAYQERHQNAMTMHGKDRVGFKVEGDFLDRGRLLRLSKAQALNCGELAAVAAEWAHSQLGKPKPHPVALASLSLPADHVFAVVGDPAKIKNLAGVKVDTLDKNISLSDDLWAADPWLKVCCHLRDYGTKAALQFKKWQGANKRVSWGTGPLDCGWYAPEGKYSAGFAAASLVIQFP